MNSSVAVGLSTAASREGVTGTKLICPAAVRLRWRSMNTSFLLHLAELRQSCCNTIEGAEPLRATLHELCGDVTLSNPLEDYLFNRIIHNYGSAPFLRWQM